MWEHSFKYPYNDVSLNMLRIHDKFIMYNKSLGKACEQIYTAILGYLLRSLISQSIAKCFSSLCQHHDARKPVFGVFEYV